MSLDAESAIERPLPHSAEAERAILSAILLGGPGSDDALSSVEPSEFFLPQHQVLFRHMRRLREHCVPTDDYILLHESLGYDRRTRGSWRYCVYQPDTRRSTSDH